MRAGEVVRLEAEARYHRERLGLYRARAYGSDTTTPGRLRELERTAAQAERRLRAVREKSNAK
jgi:hypothetical protein